VIEHRTQAEFHSLGHGCLISRSSSWDQPLEPCQAGGTAEGRQGMPEELPGTQAFLQQQRQKMGHQTSWVLSTALGDDRR